MSGRSALSPEQLRAIHARLGDGGGTSGGLTSEAVQATTAAIGAALNNARVQALRDGTKHPGRKRFSR